MARVSPNGCFGIAALTLERRTGANAASGLAQASVGSVGVWRTNPIQVPRGLTLAALETAPAGVSARSAPVATSCA